MDNDQTNLPLPEEGQATANSSDYNDLLSCERNSLSREIAIGIVTSKTDTRPKARRGTARAVIGSLITLDEQNREKDGPAFLQGACQEGGSRSDIQGFDIIALDADDGEAPEPVFERAVTLDVAVAMHSSHSDGTVNQDGRELHKYRLLVVFDRTLAREELGPTRDEQTAVLSAIRSIVAELLNVQDDPKCKNIDRFFFTHRRPEGAKHWHMFNTEGRAFSADALLRLGKARVAAEKPKRAQRPKKSRKKAGRKRSVNRQEVDAFCKKHRDAMDIEQLVEECIDDAQRKGIGIEAECPNRFGTDELGDGRSSAGHTNEEGGRKLFAVNAENSECGTAAIMCQHATCTEDLSFEDFVWLIMQEGGLTVDDLSDYVPGLVDQFELNSKDMPKASRHNLRVGLRRQGITIRLNEFTNAIEQTGIDRYPSKLTDAAITHIRETLIERFGLTFKKDHLNDLLDDEAHRNSYHPVRERLLKLKPTWDGTNRVDDFLIRYFGVEDTPLNRLFGRLFLIAAVRRIMRPGCKFDQILVLYSEQGMGKSTALKIMALEDDLFTDSLPINADSKLVIEQTSGKWIVEIAELAGMKKAEVEMVKAFASRSVDTARLAYARRSSEVPRQFIAVATTNDEKFLKDPTGNRRFWPARCVKIDLEALEADREQIWAEAAHREAQDEPIELPPEYYAEAAGLQQAHMIENQYVDKLQLELGDETGKIPATYVYEILGLPTERQQQYTTEAIGRAMKELGWEKRQLSHGGRRVMCFVRGDTPEERSREIETTDLGGKRELKRKKAQPALPANDDNPNLAMLPKSARTLTPAKTTNKCGRRTDGF